MKAKRKKEKGIRQKTEDGGQRTDDRIQRTYKDKGNWLFFYFKLKTND
jgi:hypothetical protein